MDDFDGRGMAVGIAGGVVVGLAVDYFLNTGGLTVGIFAAIGAILGINAGWFKRGD